MAVTIKQLIEIKNTNDYVSLPVASGETILKGTLVAVGNDGLLYDLDSASIPGARCVGVVADDASNDPAVATTSAGSVSGAREEQSAIAGDKTVRRVYLSGDIRLTFTSIAQTDLMKTMYATDNYTLDEAMTAGVKAGTLITYISSTEGWLRLNTYYNLDGSVMYKGALVGATTTAGGDVLSWANPTGETILITRLIFDVSTQATGAANIDAGVAAGATTSSDTLIDGADIGTAAAVFDNTVDGGTNGKGAALCTNTQFVTGTPSADADGLVGTFAVIYRIWE